VFLQVQSGHGIVKNAALIRIVMVKLQGNRHIIELASQPQRGSNYSITEK
jgi:hypothetical protein